METWVIALFVALLIIQAVVTYLLNETVFSPKAVSGSPSIAVMQCGLLYITLLGLDLWLFADKVNHPLYVAGILVAFTAVFTVILHNSDRIYRFIHQ